MKVLKLINAYCSTKFTLMTNKLDSMVNSPWSTSITNNDQDSSSDSNSCLFDLVNGLYLIDSCLIEKAFKYLRAAELNYLEFYEKYFILYNSCNANQYKIAAQYLWLFQKLNASSIGSTDINNGANQSNNNHNQQENQLDSNETSILFRFFSKSSSQLLDLVNKSNQMHHEQRMHFRLIITIYLANSLVNEAYDLIKPQIKLIKSSVSSSIVNINSLKISKELMIHFFNESERFKLMNKMIKISSVDNDFLLMLLNYLEAKQTLSSISVAIDLHVSHRNYKRAIDLYERHAKQITNSEFNYLISIIDIAKEMSQSNNFSSTDDSTSYQKNKEFSIITVNDLKEVSNFQYKFTVPLKELCKNSKRCSRLLNEKDDLEYLELLKLPELEFLNTNITIATNGSQKIVGQELTNLISNTMTPMQQTPLSKSSLQSSLKKRKASTPFMKNNLDEDLELEHPSTPTNIIAANVIIQNNNNNNNKFISQSEFKSRVLTSSLKLSKNVSNSVSKSVKFKLVKYTREISDENKDYRDNEQNIEEEIEEQQLEEEVVVQVKNSDSERRQLFLDEEDEDKEMMDQDVHEANEKEKEENIVENINLPSQNEEEIKNKIEENVCYTPNKESIANDIQIDLPILNNFDNLRKSIINNIVSAVSPVRNNNSCLDDSLASPTKTITNPNISITKTKTVLTVVDDGDIQNQQEEKNETEISNQNDIEMEINEESKTEENEQILNQTSTRKSVQFTQLDMNQDHRASPVKQIEQNSEDDNETTESVKNKEDDETKIITTIKTTITTTTVELNDENNLEQVNDKENKEENCAMNEIIVEEVESKKEVANKIEENETTSDLVEGKKETDAVNSTQETTSTQENPSSDEKSSLKKGGSIIFELSEENKADLSHNSINDSDLTLNKSNEQDEESFQLNMSSVSAHCENQSPSRKPSQEHNDSNSKIKLPKEEEPSRLSRTNSESSLFSHISSVSEHYERLKKAEENKITSKPPARTAARPPLPKVNRLMDDNELNIIKKAAAEESNENSKKTGGTALRRRRSDLSSASSSASESSSAAAVAKIRANMQKLPPTLGSNDHEVRVTRSKLKALIEHPEQSNDTPTPKKQARMSRVKKQTLELVEELDEPAKMSVSNLKKHNAEMDKLAEADEETIQDDHKRKIPTATTRTTRSAKVTRSPSPTASSVISDTTIASIQSQATSSASTKRRGRPPKAPSSIVSSTTTTTTKNLSQEIENLQDKTLIKSNDLDNGDELSSQNLVNQQTSPTNSVVSVASSIGASSVASSTASGRYTRRNRRTIQVDFNINEAEEAAKKQSVLTRSNSGRSYGLRSKDKTLRSSSIEAQNSATISSAGHENNEVEEKTQTRSTRGKGKTNSSKQHNKF